MRAMLVAALIAIPSAAAAFDIADSAFEVHSTVDGEVVATTTTTVPLSFDDETCWYWYIRSTEATGEVTFVERLAMPAAPESWGDLDAADPDEVAPTRIEDGGRVGISTRKATLDDGWFGHGWCLLPGDPAGPHSVEVMIDGIMVKRFDFEVVAPPAPDLPAVVMRRSERSGRFSL